MIRKITTVLCCFLFATTSTIFATGPGKIGFLSIKANAAALTNADEIEAYTWFATKYANSEFVSFDEINAGKDLSTFDVLWWHNDENIVLPQAAIDAVSKIKAFHNSGKGLLLTTYANLYLASLEIPKDNKSPDSVYEPGTPQQHSWGSGLSINGNLTHPIFATGVTIFNFGDGIDRAYLVFDNTWRSEKQAIWTLGGASPYSDLNDWKLKTGGLDLAGVEWDGNRGVTVQMAEFPKNNKGNGEGAVISIGAPAYDWKVDKEGQAGYVANSATFISNIQNITGNSIDYLRSQSTLPVALSAFSGKEINDGIQLQWTTSSESNFSHFELLRLDQENDNHTVIARIKGRGNSTNKNNYSFIDNSPNTGTNYYQLSQVDLNGNSENSKILGITYKAIISKYSAAFDSNKELVLSLLSSKDEDAEIFVTNMMGSTLFNRKVKLNGGFQQQRFSAIDLPNGLYVVSIKLSSGIVSVKVLNN